MAARGPLTTEEINIALAIRPGCRSTKDLEPHLLPDAGNAVKNLCGLFLRVIDQKVYLVRQTARDFLINTSGMTDTHSMKCKHSILSDEADTVLFEACVTYLLMDVFEIHLLRWDLYIGSNDRESASLSDTRISNKYCEEHQFFKYASTYWAEHSREAQYEEDSPSVESLLALCDTRSQRF